MKQFAYCASAHFGQNALVQILRLYIVSQVPQKIFIWNAYKITTLSFLEFN
jgi:hypothetical protein